MSHIKHSLFIFLLLQHFNLLFCSLRHVKEAISVFYATAVTSEARRQAEAFLKAWQRMPEGWTVGDELLSSSIKNGNEKESFFAAQTLTTKIRYDYIQLPSSAVVSLRDSLITRLQMGSSIPKATLRFLTLALAALVVQVRILQNVESVLMASNTLSIHRWKNGPIPYLH